MQALEPLIAPDDQDDDRPPPPRRPLHRRVTIAVVLITLVFLGYAFYSTFWRVTWTLHLHHFYNTSFDATFHAQIFLLSSDLMPIISGLISDTLLNMYIVTTASTFLSVLSAGALAALNFYGSHVGRQTFIGLFIFLHIVFASSAGTTKTMLLTLGLRQFDTVSGRRTIVRWMIWVFEIGRMTALAIMYYDLHRQKDLEFIIRLSITGACAVILIIFASMKRFYGVHTRHNGLATFRHICRELHLMCNCPVDDDDDTDVAFAPPPPDEPPQEIYNWRKAYLRRTGLLIFIFFMFGAYSASYFQANILFPIQVGRMTNDPPATLSPLQLQSEFDQGRFWKDFSSMSSSSVIILYCIIIFELLYRCVRFIRNLADKVSDFATIIIGMIFTTFSIAAALYLYNHTALESIPESTDIRNFRYQFILYGFGELFFFTGGYSMTYNESTRTLRCTAMASFQGMGSLFGAMLFTIYFLSTPDIHGGNLIWPYACVFVISMLVILYALPFFITRYRKSKADYLEADARVSRRQRRQYSLPDTLMYTLNINT